MVKGESEIYGIVTHCLPIFLFEVRGTERGIVAHVFIIALEFTTLFTPRILSNVICAYSLLNGEISNEYFLFDGEEVNERIWGRIVHFLYFRLFKWDSVDPPVMLDFLFYSQRKV